MKSHGILNIRLDSLSDEELRQTLFNWLNGSEQKTIVTPNPEFLLLARRDKSFAEILNHASLSLPDGFGLKLAAGINGFSLRRHTGVDTLEQLLQLAGGKTILFLGSFETVTAAAEKFKQKFPQIKIKTLDPGQIPNSGEAVKKNILEIQNFSPTLLVVGLGQGKQENFIARYLPQFPSVRVAIGVGGAFSMLSGQLPRAPSFMRQIGLEWLWRLVLEPKRWRRIFNAVVVFPIIVIYDKITRSKTHHL